MNLFYIPSREEMINADHIIRASFKPAWIRPASDELDEDTGQPILQRFFKAELRIWLTELTLECSYGGDVNGVAGTSNTITIWGLEADYFWDALKKKVTYWLPDLPTTEEETEMRKP